MLAYLWPQNARGKGAGIMQCGLGIGFFLASPIWLYVSPGRAGRLALHVPDRHLPALLVGLDQDLDR